MRTEFDLASALLGLSHYLGATDELPEFRADVVALAEAWQSWNRLARPLEVADLS